jgi:L-iditol 2-dehydrogenase
VYKNGTYNFPTILGHEFSGEIIETGADISSSYIGQKCAVFPLLPCRECDMCELGEYASCRNYNYFGSRCDGGFAEYIAVPFWNLVFADADLTFEKMAMLEPAAVSIHSLGRAGIEFADTVAIFGAGPIGLMLAEFSAAWGSARIILLDIDQRKLDFARKLGYKYTINPKNETYVENIMDITSGRGVDLSIEGAGASSSLAGCLKLTKPQGKIVLMGNPLDDIHIA